MIKGDVYIHNLRRRAIALRYDPAEVAPKILAKGAGVIADKIIEKGLSENVSVHQDAKLAEELTRLDLGDYIPPELYDVVAQVLIFINNLDKAQGNLRNFANG